MAWIEQVGQRQRSSRTYQDGEQFAVSAVLTDLHYESALDSGVFDTTVDMSPVRVDNAQLDGWRVVNNGWHYALGQPGDKTTDGWVGFGGRQGAHWFKFRLLRVGYLHWPTRAWDDIGGAPSYLRNKLTQSTNSTTVGPNDDEVNHRSIAEWSDVWKTPGGGGLDVSWATTGKRLKEEVTINQAGREWITASRPPATPVNETYFGFVFRVDWSDIPRAYRDGTLQDQDGDFADDGESIVLRDALDRLLAFMPTSTVTAGDGRGADGIANLRKRFWSDGGNHYMLLGVNCQILNGMKAGDLVFDPTISEDAAEAGTCNQPTTWYGGTWCGNYSGNSEDSFLRFTGITLEGTVSSSSISLYPKQLYSTPETVIHGIDEDNPAAVVTCAAFNAFTPTTASVQWDGPFTTGAYRQSGSINAIIQELIDTYTISNEAIGILVLDDGSASDNDFEFGDENHANPPHFDCVYTAASSYQPRPVACAPLFLY